MHIVCHGHLDRRFKLLSYEKQKCIFVIITTILNGHGSLVGSMSTSYESGLAAKIDS